MKLKSSRGFSHILHNNFIADMKQSEMGMIISKATAVINIAFIHTLLYWKHIKKPVYYFIVYKNKLTIN